MTRRRWAHARWLLAAMMACAEGARAAVWDIDPVVGVLGDYSTDPSLLHERNTAVGSGALTVDAPTTYIDDAMKLSVQPSVRVGDSRGYSSVASDYEHLNLKGEYDTELDTFTATGGIARDSSLSYNYLSNGATGVRRDGASAELNWDRHLSERLEFDVDGNSQRTLFAEPLGVSTLTDYNYNSIAPTVLWTSNEITKITFTGSVGRYDSLNGRDEYGNRTSTESRSANLQAGFARQLSELWTLTATGGYSRALDQSSLQEYVCCELVNTANGLAFALEAIPVNAESAQNGSVYALTLAHQGDRLSLNATASRQLTPTGFAFLSRQENYELTATYTLSERWTFNGDARVLRYQNPPVNGTLPQVNVQYYRISASWACTEHLTLALAAARASNAIPSDRYSVASNEVTLTLSRQFNHITF